MQSGSRRAIRRAVTFITGWIGSSRLLRFLPGWLPLLKEEKWSVLSFFAHDSVFSGLWCELGKCCCFRWRNWGRCVLLSWVLGLGAWAHTTALPLPDEIQLWPFSARSDFLIELNLQCCYKVAGAGKCVSAVSSGFCFSSFSSSSLFSFWSKIVPLGREEGKSNQKQTIDEFCWRFYNEKSEFILIEKAKTFYVAKKNKITIFSDFILVDF